MGFSEVIPKINTGYSTSLCNMNAPPAWLNELEEHVRDKTEYYDRFTCAFLARSIKRISEHLEAGHPVRMPPLKPRDFEEDRLEAWFNSRDRSGYMRKGKYGYYDRLDMAVENDVKKAKQVGAQIEYREIFEKTYNFLVENDIIEPPEPQINREHNDLTDEDGRIDLEAVQKGEKDGAIQDALNQLQSTYTSGEFAHERKPVDLTSPEVAPEKERPALNLEIVSGLSLLSLAEQEAVDFDQNLEMEDGDGPGVYINDFSDDKKPDLSLTIKDETVLGEITALGKNVDLRQEYKKAIGNAQAYTQDKSLDPEKLPTYFVTTKPLTIEGDLIEDEIWKRAFESHDSERPNIIPISLDIHAKLFRAFKKLDDGSLKDFERMLRGLSYAARQHNQSLDEARNTDRWLDDSISHVYDRIVEGDAQSLRDLTVTITTEDGEQIEWPLIVNGKNLKPIVDELNDLDELMGTAERPFDVDEDLAWDDAIDELYEQAHDFYAGVSELLAHEKRHLKDVKDTLKFPFLLGELREFEEEWQKQTDYSFADFVQSFNNAIRELPRMDGIGLENGHGKIYQELHTKVTSKLVNHLQAEGLIEGPQAYDLDEKIDEIQNLKDLQDFTRSCFKKSGIETKCNKQKRQCD